LVEIGIFDFRQISPKLAVPERNATEQNYPIGLQFSEKFGKFQSRAALKCSLFEVETQQNLTFEQVKTCYLRSYLGFLELIVGFFQFFHAPHSGYSGFAEHRRRRELEPDRRRVTGQSTLGCVYESSHPQ